MIGPKGLSISAAGLRRSYLAGALSPVDVIQQTFARIDADGPEINALTAVCADQALEDARASEERFRRGVSLPLDGIPFVVKDLIDTAGILTAFGSRLYRDHIPGQDAVAVDRLRKAGAILVGKAATHEFGWGITTSSALHGPTRNPWDPARIPGGSSGGSAAAIAAGFVPIALGTDTAGSIRIPSAFCGTVGLKPSRDRIPLQGVFPLANSLDHVGPMAGSIEDLQMVLSVLDGTENGKPPERTGLRNKRICLIPDLDACALTPDYMDCFADACGKLRSHGAEIVVLDWPEATPVDTFDILAPILNTEARHLHQNVLHHFPEQSDLFSPDVLKRVELAARYGPADYMRATQQRIHFTSTLSRLLAGVDAWLSPVSAVAPPPIGEDLVSVDGRMVELRTAIMGFIAPQSLTGLPACVVQASFDRDGLPIGFQLTGRFDEDHQLLALAAAVQDALRQ